MALAMLNSTAHMSTSDFRTVIPAEDKPAVEYDESFLGELEIEYLEKVSQMRSLTERLALRLESSFRYELLKLPLAVRSMTMREFCEECGGDVEQAIQHAAKRRKPAAEAMPAPSALMQPPRSIARPKPAPRDTEAPAGSRTSRRNPAANAAATPAAGGRATRGRTAAATPGGAGVSTPCVGSSAMPMMTPRMYETPRFARTGEMMLSANGSPINVLNTVKARVRPHPACPHRRAVARLTLCLPTRPSPAAAPPSRSAGGPADRAGAWPRSTTYIGRQPVEPAESSQLAVPCAHPTHPSHRLPSAVAPLSPRR